MSLLELIFHHLVLPFKIPDQREENLEVIEDDIVKRLIRAINTFESHSGENFAGTWRSLHQSLNICRKLNQGCLKKETLTEEFSRLRPKSLLILHIVEQNAAVLIRRRER
jgi:hypothetical protein